MKGTEKDPVLEQYGFKRENWLTHNRAIFPIEMAIGKPIRFGPDIYGKLRNRMFTFSVKRKAHISHVHALLGWIDESLPSINKCKVFLRRKKFELQRNLNTSEGLYRLVTSQKGTAFYRIKW